MYFGHYHEKEVGEFGEVDNARNNTGIPHTRDRLKTMRCAI